MGVVYKARQVTLNRVVAVKMILAGQLADERSVKRFHAEAEAAANLKHPNIVAIHEVGQHDGQHYFSMDYIEGRSLAERAAGKPVGAIQAATLVKTIANAIHYAHQRGVLHRDLKLSNVLVDGSGEPHVTDFGLAKTTDSQRDFTRTGDIMGTPNYMPPEQASGRRDLIGPHSDVYALGAILYELLTGLPPFHSDNPLDVLLKVIEEEPARPRAQNPEIPPDLETICLKCLEKPPQRRYPSARALEDDLDRFIRHEPVHARPASAVRKAVSWMRRHPGVLAAAMALVVFGLIAGVFYLAEENAFLRAQKSDPALSRQAGSRTEALELWNHAGLVLSAAAFLSVCLWSIWRRQGRHAAPWDPNRWNLPLQPRLRLAAAALGVAAISVCVIVLAKSIEAYVWEGSPRFLDVLNAVYVPGWLGLWLLSLVVRDYRLANFGRPAMTTEQSDAINDTLVQSGRMPAIKLYREIMKGTHLGEAKAYIDHLERQWRQRDPQAYAAATSQAREVNWRLLAICGALEAAALIVLWMALPGVRDMALDFAYGFAVGPMLLAALRLKGSTWRYVAIFVLTAVVVFFLFGVLEYYSDRANEYAPSSFTVGVLFGAALLVSGNNPKRPEKR
jgi:tRNA A-37 threonylcarbamoyl transferase component Bud32